MDDRDRQRNRVYAWEEQFIAPRAPSLIEPAQAQGMIDAIWAETGLRFPPKVERLPRQARSTMVDASRLSIRLADSSPSWCLLHELAHAMSSTHDGHSDGHGPTFMGLYAQSLEAARIEADMQAKPVFIDDQPMRRTRTRSSASAVSGNGGANDADRH
jgi:hypothetical protein